MQKWCSDINFYTMTMNIAIKRACKFHSTSIVSVSHLMSGRPPEKHSSQFAICFSRLKLKAATAHLAREYFTTFKSTTGCKFSRAHFSAPKALSLEVPIPKIELHVHPTCGIIGCAARPSRDSSDPPRPFLHSSARVRVAPVFFLFLRRTRRNETKLAASSIHR